MLSLSKVEQLQLYAATGELVYQGVAGHFELFDPHLPGEQPLHQAALLLAQ
jgi:hypothetical protein